MSSIGMNVHYTHPLTAPAGKEGILYRPVPPQQPVASSYSKHSALHCSYDGANNAGECNKLFFAGKEAETNVHDDKQQWTFLNRVIIPRPPLRTISSPGNDYPLPSAQLMPQTAPSSIGDGGSCTTSRGQRYYKNIYSAEKNHGSSADEECRKNHNIDLEDKETIVARAAGRKTAALLRQLNSLSALNQYLSSAHCPQPAKATFISEELSRPNTKSEATVCVTSHSFGDICLSSNLNFVTYAEISDFEDQLRALVLGNESRGRNYIYREKLHAIYQFEQRLSILDSYIIGRNALLEESEKAFGANSHVITYHVNLFHAEIALMRLQCDEFTTREQIMKCYPSQEVLLANVIYGGLCLELSHQEMVKQIELLQYLNFEELKERHLISQHYWESQQTQQERMKAWLLSSAFVQMRIRQHQRQEIEFVQEVKSRSDVERLWTNAMLVLFAEMMQRRRWVWECDIRGEQLRKRALIEHIEEEVFVQDILLESRKHLRETENAIEFNVKIAQRENAFRCQVEEDERRRWMHIAIWGHRDWYAIYLRKKIEMDEECDDSEYYNGIIYNSDSFVGSEDTNDDKNVIYQQEYMSNFVGGAAATSKMKKGNIKTKFNLSMARSMDMCPRSSIKFLNHDEACKRRDVLFFYHDGLKLLQKEEASRRTPVLQRNRERNAFVDSYLDGCLSIMQQEHLQFNDIYYNHLFYRAIIMEKNAVKGIVAEEMDVRGNIRTEEHYISRQQHLVHFELLGVEAEEDSERRTHLIKSEEMIFYRNFLSDGSIYNVPRMIDREILSVEVIERGEHKAEEEYVREMMMKLFHAVLHDGKLVLETKYITKIEDEYRNKITCREFVDFMSVAVLPLNVAVEESCRQFLFQTYNRIRLFLEEYITDEIESRSRDEFEHNESCERGRIEISKIEELESIKRQERLIDIESASFEILNVLFRKLNPIYVWESAKVTLQDMEAQSRMLLENEAEVSVHSTLRFLGDELFPETIGKLSDPITGVNYLENLQSTRAAKYVTVRDIYREAEELLKANCTESNFVNKKKRSRGVIYELWLKEQLEYIYTEEYIMRQMVLEREEGDWQLFSSIVARESVRRINIHIQQENFRAITEAAAFRIMDREQIEEYDIRQREQTTAEEDDSAAQWVRARSDALALLSNHDDYYNKIIEEEKNRLLILQGPLLDGVYQGMYGIAMDEDLKYKSLQETYRWGLFILTRRHNIQGSIRRDCCTHYYHYFEDEKNDINNKVSGNDVEVGKEIMVDLRNIDAAHEAEIQKIIDDELLLVPPPSVVRDLLPQPLTREAVLRSFKIREEGQKAIDQAASHGGDADRSPNDTDIYSRAIITGSDLEYREHMHEISPPGSPSYHFYYHSNVLPPDSLSGGRMDRQTLERVVAITSKNQFLSQASAALWGESTKEFYTNILERENFNFCRIYGQYIFEGEMIQRKQDRRSYSRFKSELRALELQRILNGGRGSFGEDGYIAGRLKEDDNNKHLKTSVNLSEPLGRHIQDNHLDKIIRLGCVQVPRVHHFNNFGNVMRNDDCRVYIRLSFSKSPSESYTEATEKENHKYEEEILPSSAELDAAIFSFSKDVVLEIVENPYSHQIDKEVDVDCPLTNTSTSSSSSVATYIPKYIADFLIAYETEIKKLQQSEEEYEKSDEFKDQTATERKNRRKQALNSLFFDLFIAHEQNWLIPQLALFPNETACSSPVYIKVTVFSRGSPLLRQVSDGECKSTQDVFKSNLKTSAIEENEEKESIAPTSNGTEDVMRYEDEVLMIEHTIWESELVPIHCPKITESYKEMGLLKEEQDDLSNKTWKDKEERHRFALEKGAPLIFVDDNTLSTAYVDSKRNQLQSDSRIRSGGERITDDFIIICSKNNPSNAILCVENVPDQQNVMYGGTDEEIAYQNRKAAYKRLKGARNLALPFYYYDSDSDLIDDEMNYIHDKPNTPEPVVILPSKVLSDICEMMLSASNCPSDSPKSTYQSLYKTSDSPGMGVQCQSLCLPPKCYLRCGGLNIPEDILHNAAQLAVWSAAIDENIYAKRKNSENSTESFLQEAEQIPENEFVELCLRLTVRSSGTSPSDQLGKQCLTQCPAITPQTFIEMPPPTLMFLSPPPSHTVESDPYHSNGEWTKVISLFPEYQITANSLTVPSQDEANDPVVSEVFDNDMYTRAIMYQSHCMSLLLSCAARRAAGKAKPERPLEGIASDGPYRSYSSSVNHTYDGDKMMNKGEPILTAEKEQSDSLNNKTGITSEYSNGGYSVINQLRQLRTESIKSRLRVEVDALGTSAMEDLSYKRHLIRFIQLSAPSSWCVPIIDDNGNTVWPSSVVVEAAVVMIRRQIETGEMLSEIEILKGEAEIPLIEKKAETKLNTNDNDASEVHLKGPLMTSDISNSYVNNLEILSVSAIHEIPLYFPEEISAMFRQIINSGDTNVINSPSQDDLYVKEVAPIARLNLYTERISDEVSREIQSKALSDILNLQFTERNFNIADEKLDTNVSN